MEGGGLIRGGGLIGGFTVCNNGVVPHARLARARGLFHETENRSKKPKIGRKPRVSVSLNRNRNQETESENGSKTETKTAFLFH